MSMFGKKGMGAVLGGVVAGPMGAMIGDQIQKHGGVGGAISNATGKIFGNRNDAGILGTGQFRADQHQIDDAAFESPEAMQRQIEFANAIQGVMNRQGPTLDQTAANQWRGQQDLLAQNLQATLRGEGPSVAQMQMRQGLNQSLGNAASLAASQRGVSPAMAMRMAQQNQAQMAQGVTGQSAMLRAQEQMAARGELANLSSQARTQDLNAAAANQNAAMQQRQLNDGMERFFREGQMVMDDRNRQAMIERERLKSGQATAANQINAGAYDAAAKNRSGMLGGLGSAVASIATMFSDEKLKTGVKDGSRDIKGFLDALGAHAYEYKDPAHGKGKHVSPMAQELEATELGKNMVEDTPEGKLVDYGKASGAMLAGQVMLNDRLNEIEEQMAEFFKAKKGKG